MGRSRLMITSELSSALSTVLGSVPSYPSPVVVVAAYLTEVARGYGLSESLQITHDAEAAIQPPRQAFPLLRQHLGGLDDELTPDQLRELIYETTVQLAERQQARRMLNKNDPLPEPRVLALAQIYWNIEATPQRPLLPIGPADGSDIPAGAGKDFATLRWTQRCNQKMRWKTSGQSFRIQAARLAVMMAQQLVDTAHHQDQVTGAQFVIDSTRKHPRIVGIEWAPTSPKPAAEEPPTQPIGASQPGWALPEAGADAKPSRTTTWSPAADASSAAAGHSDGGNAAGGNSGDSLLSAGAMQPVAAAVHPGVAGRAIVRIGRPSQVARTYQERDFEAHINRIWSSDHTDRRVWLRGGPGVGKTYTARRIMQDAVTASSRQQAGLLVWVESAEPDSVRASFAKAWDQLRVHSYPVPGSPTDTAERKTEALLRTLATCRWPWLVVFDNADAAAVIDARLLPPGTNPLGRTLITTTSNDPRIATNGHLIAVGLFSVDEADQYLRAQQDPLSGKQAHLAAAPQAVRARFAYAVGYQPLALSIAAATVAVNRLDVDDWVAEFEATEQIDLAAQSPDPGGYPHQISTTWQLALRNAAADQPKEMVRRAALVAALQDPDGHPTWMWQDPRLLDWVGDGAAVEFSYGQPAPIRRLLEHNVVTLQGETWKSGKVAIHQLAARAIRELCTGAEIDEVSAIVVAQWLRAAADEATHPALVSNLTALEQMPGISPRTRADARTLIRYAAPALPDSYRVLLESKLLEELEDSLYQSGTHGRRFLATQLTKIAAQKQDLGRLSSAEAHWQQAAQLYGELIADNVDNPMRAVSMAQLANIYDQLGQPEEATRYRVATARLWLELRRSIPEQSFLDLLVWLSRLYQKFANKADWPLDAPETFLQPLVSSLEPEPPTGAGDTSAARLMMLGSLWMTGGDVAQNFQLPDQALECYRRGLDYYRHGCAHTSSDDPQVVQARTARLEAAVRQVIGLGLQQGLWEQVEEWIGILPTPTSEELVQLAIVQAHRGETALAVASLGEASRSMQAEVGGPAAESPTSGADAGDLEDQLRTQYRSRLAEALLANITDGSDGSAPPTPVADLFTPLQDHSLSHSSDTGEREFLASMLVELGREHSRLGEFDSGISLITDGVQIYEELMGQPPDQLRLRPQLVEALGSLAYSYAQVGAQQDDQRSQPQSQKPNQGRNAGEVLGAGAAFERAEAMIERALAALGPSSVAEAVAVPPGAGWLQLWGALLRLSAWYLQQDNPAVSRQHSQNALAHLQAGAEHFGADLNYQKCVAQAHALIGRSYFAEDAATQSASPNPAAQESLEQATDLLGELFTRTDTPDAELRNQLEVSLGALTQLHQFFSHPQRALVVLQEAQTYAQLLLDVDPHDVEASAWMAQLLAASSRIYAADGDLDKAQELARDARRYLLLPASMEPTVYAPLLVDVAGLLEQD